MKKILLAIILSLLVINYGDSYKILSVVPHFGGSHVKFMGKVADILVRGGHEVTALMIPLEPDLKMVGTKLAKIINIEKNNETMKLVEQFFKSKNVWESGIKDIINARSLVKNFVLSSKTNCRGVITNSSLIEYLKNEKFDLAITQHIDFCAFGLFKLLDIPAHVSLFAGGLMPSHFKRFGLTFPLAQLPDITLGVNDKEMTFFNRLKNIFSFMMLEMYSNNMMSGIEEVFNEEFGDGYVDIKQQLRDATFHISNSDPFVDLAYPTLSKIVQIGGFSIPKPNALNKEWDSLLSKRKKNVLISFGSIAKSVLMPKEYKEGLIETIKQFPDITFIWKYENPEDGFAKDIENVYLNKWVPQTDLLNDPRLSVFITHGGLNSLSESAHYGMPLIVIPLFADQPRNAKIIEKLGFGKILEKHNLKSPEIIKKTIEDMLEDNNIYRETAKNIKEMIKNRPYNQTDIFIKHIEFAAKFKKLPNLNMEGHQISIFQYALLDVILFLIFIIVLILSIIFYGIYSIYKCIRRKVCVKCKNKKE
ncbi:UDP-glucuronosyl/UDP-glucosyltransferase family-containing protein [Strongyloides ratti]|uniref:UDP-glucuronosyltransferase n=1 Tax=Strongyloides ratti TaxID=34506 RepID=A0A090MZA6_STRRB|nr:UDP-glucuronosyl/UDP-glucosyltransferase family-containing protein [Strongyloides ratti]CEF68599.1 UDP-glucuronosyl/UDP-glucosyltransferase family-containing protein [Strongyloides ratti]